MLRQLRALGVDVEHERERARTAEASPKLPPTGAARAWEREMQKQWAQEALVRPPARLAKDGREPRVATRSHRHPIPNAFGRDVADYQLLIEEKAVQAWGASEKENKHSLCRPHPEHWRPSRDTNTQQRTVDEAEPGAGFVRPEGAEEPEVGLLCPTGRLCWEPWEEHNLHPTQRAMQQRMVANRQRQLHRHGVRAPSDFVQEREVATKQFKSAGVPNGKELPPRSEKLGQMMVARSKAPRAAARALRAAPPGR